MKSEIVDRDWEKLLPKILERLFPATEERDEAISILSRYCLVEVDRVRLGILKASKGDLKEMKRLAEIAACDWRDLLCIAEYPLTSRRRGLKQRDPARYDKLLEKEQNEYDQWLKSVLAI